MFRVCGVALEMSEGGSGVPVLKTIRLRLGMLSVNYWFNTLINLKNKLGGQPLGFECVR